METIDPQKARRVWQRVHSTAPVPQPPDPQPLPAATVLQPEQLWMLIRQEWLAGARYTRLSRQPGPYRQLFNQMAQQEQSHLTVLKGIWKMLTGQQPQVLRPALEPSPDLLRRCYAEARQAVIRYEALAENPEYGRVFRLLAQQEQDHCRKLLMILGSR